jgi:hypothetical protein
MLPPKIERAQMGVGATEMWEGGLELLSSRQFFFASFPRHLTPPPLFISQVRTQIAVALQSPLTFFAGSSDPSMAGGSSSSKPAAQGRKRVEATVLKRSRDGSAFTRWLVALSLFSVPMLADN